MSIADIYRYMWTSDIHNEMRHDGVTNYQNGLDSEWVTTWWTIQVFDLFIACTKSNAYLSIK